ncbi:amphiphysin isoform X2 [Hoplias malabaricus]|uniref:amphiphysin isoform X2 n=1 Tax=Hoplias malabaricus TaxID=27720 RepID=UPI00346290FA
MAEIKTGIFAKNVQKRISRAQEKVLQKLGKADETKDEQFEQFVQNFKHQETEGARLQREMKAYIAAVKGMQQASMNLTESLHEVYEPDWHGKDDVMSIGKSCDTLWEDFHEKLVDSTLIALDTYLAQFPDLKVRVAKRSRKLIDYDSARHHLETLQTSTVRSEKKIAKAEEDLKKAQRVFDDLNVDLQNELPELWDSRVNFYVNTFKSVSSLEAKFHREISFLCHKLYEVMNKLAEQHSDKMFTIQGAPSDSGPLRLARTPTPPEDESPEISPVASPNHTLRPTSPGPPRPKSPSQLKIGPPKPPPPKVTPTREVAQEQIIDLFEGGFPEISVTSPQPNERPGESLLDLDFDPFKPDSNTTIGQTQSPAAQALPWDLWTGNTEAQPAPDAGFTANWTADFGSATGASAEDSGAALPANDGQGWPPAEGWPSEAAPQGEETTDEADGSAPAFVADFDKMSEAPEGAEASAEAGARAEAEASAEAGAEAEASAEAGAETAPESEVAPTPEGEVTPAPVAEAGEGGPITTPPTEIPTEPTETTAATSPPTEEAPSTVESPAAAENEAAKQIETSPAEVAEKEQGIQDAPEFAPEAEAGEEPHAEALASAEEKESPIEETPNVETKVENEAGATETKPEEEAGTVETKPEEEAGTVEAKPEEEAGTIEAKPEEEAGTVEAKPEEEAGTTETKPEEEAGTIETKPEEEADTVETKPEEEAGTAETKPEEEADTVETKPEAQLGTVESKPEDEAGKVVVKPAGETSKEGAEKEEKMPIPSVVIEPASSNEGDDDRDGDITSPTATSGNEVTPDSQSAKDISSSGMPPGFIFKVETMHDFDAANPDELELKRGDVVLVVPTELAEDQDAGWLTGIRETDWLQRGASAQKGLFPENFTQRLG